MKLWEKDKKTSNSILEFTIGKDREFDASLAPFDVLGSMAHALMLGKTNIISENEATELFDALFHYYPVTEGQSFELDPGDEDIHSHLEGYLVKTIGETGKKIHTGRSRNDQVMVAMILYFREEMRLVLSEAGDLMNTLLGKGNEFKTCLLPGYTHTQVAMPSSFGLWLGAYAERFLDDMEEFQAVYKVINKNPLGSAAGYGSSFPIDRELTTHLLGFSELMISSATAQLNRSRIESRIASGLSAFANTLSRLANDIVFFIGQDTSFLSFPDELTTGSSIMPHKKNPDVLELIRAHCNVIAQNYVTLNGLSANLISGYHRDFQLTKEMLFPSFQQLRNCLKMMNLMVENMLPAEDILSADKYQYAFSVEVVNNKVIQGKSFREAYREVAEEIEKGIFKTGPRVDYTHIGSIGNPGIEMIRDRLISLSEHFSIMEPEEVLNKMKTFKEEAFYHK
ncbi:MAG: argininosuccinate lyase [Bacteroidales bacterium]|nr:argininosuccinate lyase [Bacteroidales bacterium]